MYALRIAAIVGFLAVALGAAGAHGQLQELLARNGKESIWHTATLYHLVHAVVLLAIALRLDGAARAVPIVSWLFLAGIVFFSGSLYLLSVANVKWLGPVTPLGGVCLLAGWLWLAFKGVR